MSIAGRTMVLHTGLLSVYRQLGSVPNEEASNFYIQIPSELLSEPYELGDEASIEGKIVKLLGADQRVRSEFTSIPIDFILQRSVAFDHLYILKSHWKTNFRDRGLVRPSYRMDVILDKAMRRGSSEIIMLYPKGLVGIDRNEPDR